MSVAIHPDRPPPPAVAWRDAGLLTCQLGVIREMIASLDTLTAAGQRLTMGKVVAFIDGELRRGAIVTGARNRAAVSSILSTLSWESQRMLPDTRNFSARADALVSLLTALLMVPGPREDVASA